MSRLEELINELCPDGVHFCTLDNVLKIKNGRDYKNFAQGDIPVYGSGGVIAYINVFAYDKPSVLIPRKGSIDKLYYVDTPFWTVDTIFYTDINTDLIEPKYVYYCLKNQHLEKLNTAGGVPSLTQAVLNKVKIPLPPLEVQQEIVRILDTFTELTTELITKLTTELEARKKQYEYYREKLLNQNIVDNIPLIKLCDIKGRIGFRGYTKNDIVNKGQGAISFSPSNIINGNIEYKSNTYISLEKYEESPEIMVKEGDILLCKTGSTLGKVAIVENLSEKATINPQLVVLKNIKCNIRYLKYIISGYNFQNEIHKRKGMGSVPNISQRELGKIIVPIPSLQEQERIVSILDRFDSLCNDITKGIPAEIEARKKQYEYYRDKLLTFKELKKEGV